MIQFAKMRFEIAMTDDRKMSLAYHRGLIHGSHKAYISSLVYGKGGRGYFMNLLI